VRLSWYQRTAYRLFGKQATKSKALPKLAKAISKARTGVRAEAVLAQARLTGLLTGLAVFLLALSAAPLVVETLGPAAWVLPFLIAPSAAYMGYYAVTATPASTAKKRGKDIDRKLPYATNYIAAMTSAGVVPSDVWRSLAQQRIYGEAAVEAAGIFKDLQVHGKDIITALTRAADRSPSGRFRDLLQGAITTVTSGGDLTRYFRQKADRYQFEGRVEQKTFIETMGLMAETYVTVAVAGPLFLIVMVAIIVLMGSGAFSQMQMLIYLLLPVLNIGFIFGLRAMIPEV
jgi:archaeal flagellar protein FlaJ